MIKAIVRLVAALLMTLLLMLLWVPHTFPQDKTFRGKVIDSDTKEPIEGAVIVVYWYEARSTPFLGESTRLKEVKECLTDKNGEWKIVGEEGRGLNPDPSSSVDTGSYYTRKPEFIIFMPGYCSWPKGFSVKSCQGRMRSTGAGTIMEGKTIELPKLVNREDRLNVLADAVGEDITILRKQKTFMKLINIERKNLDLDENETYKELINEK